MSKEETIRTLQRFIDEDRLKKLEGHHRALAQLLIGAGLCHPAKKRRRPGRK